MGIPNTSPVHIATLKSWIVTIPATANANRDGTGTITDIVNAPVAGKQSLGARVKIKATGVTTAGMIRIFGHNGTTYFLMEELTVAAQAAPGATVKTSVAGAADGLLDAQGYYVFNIPFGDTVAGTIQKIGISTHNAEAFAAHVIGDGDFQ